ncbi:MAG TPA: hypothetical protein ENF21_09045 [Bacteroidetes bacterium]|nr:hypothetical protein [Bacteroidota bacterium]
MKNILYFLGAFIILAFIHESLHAVIAWAYGEFDSFVVHFYGFEVVYKTPVNTREGIQWGFISGTPNIVTVLLGYLLFGLRKRIAGATAPFFRALGFWLILLFLVADPLNLSIGPFIYGGDAGGIVKGFGINLYLLQVLTFIIFLLNRELIARKLLPDFGIKTRHPLFVPWFQNRKTQKTA